MPTAFLHYGKNRGFLPGVDQQRFLGGSSRHDPGGDSSCYTAFVANTWTLPVRVTAESGCSLRTRHLEECLQGRQDGRQFARLRIAQKTGFRRRRSRYRLSLRRSPAAVEQLVDRLPRRRERGFPRQTGSRAPNESLPGLPPRDGPPGLGLFDVPLRRARRAIFRQRRSSSRALPVGYELSSRRWMESAWRHPFVQIVVQEDDYRRFVCVPW